MFCMTENKFETIQTTLKKKCRSFNSERTEKGGDQLFRPNEVISKTSMSNYQTIGK